MANIPTKKKIKALETLRKVSKSKVNQPKPRPKPKKKNESRLAAFARAMKKLLSPRKSLEKKGKNLITGQRKKYQNLRDRRHRDRLKEAGATEKEIDRMGYGGKRPKKAARKK